MVLKKTIFTTISYECMDKDVIQDNVKKFVIIQASLHRANRANRDKKSSLNKLALWKKSGIMK